ncbi:MAG: aldehyde dehydrogenase family protein, partial [Mycobacterium sp.]
MTRHLQNFIHGQSVASTSARRGDLVNPATGEVFASADVSGSQDVERAFDSSHRAFADWSRTTPA